MIKPQELIEKITAAADYDDCIVIINEKTQANLRWASSTLTTNGVIAERSVTVIAFVATRWREWHLARSLALMSPRVKLLRLLKEAGLAARAAGRASDAMELAKNVSNGDWNAASSSNRARSICKNRTRTW
jgi:hypothetical protein